MTQFLIKIFFDEYVDKYLHGLVKNKQMYFSIDSIARILKKENIDEWGLKLTIGFKNSFTCITYLNFKFITKEVVIFFLQNNRSKEARILLKILEGEKLVLVKKNRLNEYILIHCKSAKFDGISFKKWEENLMNEINTQVLYNTSHPFNL